MIGLRHHGLPPRIALRRIVQGKTRLQFGGSQTVTGRPDRLSVRRLFPSMRVARAAESDVFTTVDRHLIKQLAFKARLLDIPGLAAHRPHLNLAKLWAFGTAD